MKKKPQTDYWHYDIEKKWQRKVFPALASYDEIKEFVDDLGYLPKPDAICGDELDYFEMYQHPTEDSYFFKLSLQKYTKILFSSNTPSALRLYAQLKEIVL